MREQGFTSRYGMLKQLVDEALKNWRDKKNGGKGELEGRDAEDNQARAGRETETIVPFL